MIEADQKIVEEGGVGNRIVVRCPGEFHLKQAVAYGMGQLDQIVAEDVHMVKGGVRGKNHVAAHHPCGMDLNRVAAYG